MLALSRPRSVELPVQPLESLAVYLRSSTPTKQRCAYTRTRSTSARRRASDDAALAVAERRRPLAVRALASDLSAVRIEVRHRALAVRRRPSDDPPVRPVEGALLGQRRGGQKEGQRCKEGRSCHDGSSWLLARLDYLHAILALESALANDDAAMAVIDRDSAVAGGRLTTRDLFTEEHSGCRSTPGL